MAQYFGWVHDRLRKLHATIKDLEDCRTAQKVDLAEGGGAASPEEEAGAKASAAAKLMYHAMAKLFELARLLRAPKAVDPLMSLIDCLPPETRSKDEKQPSFACLEAQERHGGLYGEPQVHSVYIFLFV